MLKTGGERIPQHQLAIAFGRPRRNTAGQHIAVGRDIAQRPGPLAASPGPLVRGWATETLYGGCGPRSLEHNARLLGQSFCLTNQVVFALFEVAMQRLLLDRQPVPIEHQSLGIDLWDAKPYCEPDKGGEFIQVRLERGKPQRDAWRVTSAPLL